MKRDLPHEFGLVVGTEAPPGASAGVPIDAMLDPVLVVDASRRIVAVNAATCRLLRAGAAALEGRDLLAFATGPEDHCFWAEAAAGTGDESALDSECRFTTAIGEQVPVRRRVTPTFDSGGARRFVVVLRDRSAEERAERRLEAALADLRATLESTCDGLLVTDLGGAIRHCNRRFAALWRIPAELLAERDDDAVHEWMRRSVDDPAGYMRRLAEIDAALLPETRDRFRLHDGSVLERIATVQRLHDRPVGRVYAFRRVAEAERSRRAGGEDRGPRLPA